MGFVEEQCFQFRGEELCDSVKPTSSTGGQMYFPPTREGSFGLGSII